jgi:hypothetical protein
MIRAESKALTCEKLKFSAVQKSKRYTELFIIGGIVMAKIYRTNIARRFGKKKKGRECNTRIPRFRNYFKKICLKNL